MMKVLPQQLRLYAVTDSRRLRGRTLLDTVAAALDGGATFVQLREKEPAPWPNYATRGMCPLW